MAETSTEIDWASFDTDTLNVQLSPRRTVPDVDAKLAGWAARSAALRDGLNLERDLHYGDGPLETVDWIAPSGPRAGAALMFIHGGYWRALDKDDHTFIAPPYLAAGLDVVVVNHPLCPSVTLDGAVEAVRAACRFTCAEARRRGLERIVIAGHSAGAHLAAMLLETPPPRTVELAGAALISGIFDPRPVPRLDMNAEIGLTPDMARRNNVLSRPLRALVPTIVAAGSKETELWQGESRRCAAWLAAAGVPVSRHLCEGSDHFTILDRMAAAADPLCAAVIGLARGAR